MKIAFLTFADPENRRVWSGIPYYMKNALQAHCGEVFYIGPVTSYIDIFGKICNRISSGLLKKKYDYKRSIIAAKRYGSIIEKRIKGRSFDVIFVAAGAPLIAYLNTSVPIVLSVDTTFSNMVDYYPEYSRLTRVSIAEGHRIAKLAIKRATLLIYSSSYAGESAINYYGAPPERVHVIPFGANIEEGDIPTKESIYKKCKGNECRLLFLGVDWKRKGGDIAFDSMVELERAGIKTSLTVCGCQPPASYSHSKMKVIPFLDKNNSDDRAKLIDLFLNADFLLLPTRSEAYGIVFCEANAFGLPVIATDTGGVSEIVKNGYNGFLLSRNAEANDYARTIMQIWNDELKYFELVQNSRKSYDQRLNWDAWGKAVKKAIATIL